MGGRGQSSSASKGKGISVSSTGDHILLDENGLDKDKVYHGNREDWWNIEDGWTYEDKSKLKNQEYPFSELEQWAGNGYLEIRPASIGESSDKKYIDAAEKIEKYISESGGYNMTMYRGVTLDKKLVNKLKVGKELDQKGISSWSKHLDTAVQFSYSGDADIPVVFRMQKSSKARDISAYNRQEMEILLSSKSSQVITNMTTKNGIMYIDVKEV